MPFEVIVAVNEPSFAVRDLLEDQLVGVRVSLSEENLGFGGAYNVAATTARGEYLVLLNDDTEICPGWLDALVEVADRRDAGAVASCLLDRDGTIQEAGGIFWRDGWTWSVGRGLPGDSMTYDFEREVDYGSAASLLVRRDLWEKLGGFDPRYFPATFEDADLCMRIKAAGASIWFAPRSRIVHFESQSTNTIFRQFLMDRNHAIFCDRWQGVLDRHEPRVRAHTPAVDRGVWRARGSRTRVLVIDDRAPDAGVGSGFARMVELLDALGGDPELEVFFFASVIDGALAHDQLTRLGIGVIDEPLSDHLERVGVGYDCVIVSRPHNYERLVPTVRRFSDAPVIYDAEALYARRLARQAELAEDPTMRAELIAATELQREAEVAIAKDADFAVCLAEEEAEFFRAHGSCPIEIMPPVLADIAVTPSPVGARRGIGYVPGWLGGVESPNVAALRWFATAVLPLVVAEIPDAELLVTGGNPPETALEHASSHVRFLGRVEDLHAFYDSVRVVISPMTYGAGVKIKTIEALQHGVPTVATSVGGEGVPVEYAASLPIHDDAASFAGEVVALLRDDAHWETTRARVVAEAERWSASFTTPRWPALVRGLALTEPRLVAPVEVGAGDDDAPLPIDSLFVAGWVTAPTYDTELSPSERTSALREEYLRYLEVEVERRSVALTDELKATHTKLFDAETALFHERRRSAELERQWAGLAAAYEGTVADLAAARGRRVVRIADRIGPRIRPLRRVARPIVHGLRAVRRRIRQ